LVFLGNVGAAIELLWKVIYTNVNNNPGILLGSGAAIFFTNVIIFGIWYWQIDRGGPIAREESMGRGNDPYPDFLFSQTSPTDDGTSKRGIAPPNWQPTFVDYLYVSYTNVVAFSPTDTMPLTGRAKILMSAQSVVALTTLVFVIARAVNVIGPNAPLG